MNTCVAYRGIPFICNQRFCWPGGIEPDVERGEQPERGEQASQASGFPGFPGFPGQAFHLRPRMRLLTTTTWSFRPLLERPPFESAANTSKRTASAGLPFIGKRGPLDDAQTAVATGNRGDRIGPRLELASGLDCFRRARPRERDRVARGGGIPRELSFAASDHARYVSFA